MFFPGSRYYNLGTYTVTTKTGVAVQATLLPRPKPEPLLGFHRRLESHRLDLIAQRYLADPNGFFRLCDANGSIVPDALASHDLVGIPRKGG